MAVPTHLRRLQLETADTGQVEIHQAIRTSATGRPHTPMDRFLRRLHPDLVPPPPARVPELTSLPSYMRLTGNLLDIRGDEFDVSDYEQITNALSQSVVTSLVIENASALDPRSIEGLFPSVNLLQLIGIREDFDCSGYAHLAHLRTVHVDSASANLDGLHHLTGVKTYQFTDCTVEVLPLLNPEVESLSLHRCSEVTDVIVGYRYLKTLSIQDLEKTRSISIFRSTKLAKVEVNYCPALLSFKGPLTDRDMFTSMQSLHINSCPALEYLSTDSFPPDLKTLELRDCNSFDGFRVLMT